VRNLKDFKRKVNGASLWLKRTSDLAGIILATHSTEEMNNKVHVLH
jgi:hypothetical protein